MVILILLRVCVIYFSNGVGDSAYTWDDYVHGYGYGENSDCYDSIVPLPILRPSAEEGTN